MSKVCQLQQVLQLDAKLEEAVENLSTVNMSLREENREQNCLLQVRVPHEHYYNYVQHNNLYV